MQELVDRLADNGHEHASLGSEVVVNECRRDLAVSGDLLECDGVVWLLFEHRAGGVEDRALARGRNQPCALAPSLHSLWSPGCRLAPSGGL